jgi:nucleoside-diphosphate-sugar epimerase
VNHVLDVIRRVSGRSPSVDVDPPQKGDMRHTFADTQLARTDLGFVPMVTLEDGLAAEYRWLRETM